MSVGHRYLIKPGRGIRRTNGQRVEAWLALDWRWVNNTAVYFEHESDVMFTSVDDAMGVMEAGFEPVNFKSWCCSL